VQPFPILVRAATLVIAAGVLCSCTDTAKSGSGAGVPSSSSSEVVKGRFVSPLDIDNGGLVVDPAGTARPSVSSKVALAMFHAADIVGGDYRFSVFGLGVVTISTQVPGSSTSGPGATTTSIPSSGTTSIGTTQQGSATTTTSNTTTATTTVGSTTGTATTTTTTAAAPGSAQSTTTEVAPPAPAALPVYNGRVAWVGIAWGIRCPVGASGFRAPTRYVAVVIDAETGRSVLAFTSRSAAVCNGPVVAASVSRPDELVSVPWQPVSLASTAVDVTLPACATYYGWTEVAASGTDSVQVVARVPFDSGCSSTAPMTETVDDVVPLGRAQAQVPHAALGPVDALRTLPGG
jgi:hypothetical protein